MTWLQAIPYPSISPVFFEIGPLQFRWYGLMYLIGLAAAYFYITYKADRSGLAISKDQIYDMVVWAALGIFIGGRLGYTLFYNFSYYIQHPAKIVAVWEGGMSFHGGLLGTIVSLIWFSKRQGIPIYTIADLAAAVTPIGLGFGRLRNDWVSEKAEIDRVDQCQFCRPVELDHLLHGGKRLLGPIHSDHDFHAVTILSIAYA